jgi:hypothetical protein
MKRILMSALVAIAIAGCATPATPAATPSTANQVAPEDDGTRDLAAKMKAAEEAQAKEYEGATAAQGAEVQAAQAAGQAKFDAEQRANAAAAKASADAKRVSCAASRGARFASGRGIAIQAGNYVVATVPNKAWIDAHCTLVDSHGTNYTVKREGGGVTVRARQVGRTDAVSCTGTRPARLTENDIRNYLGGAAASRLDEIDEHGDVDCRAADQEVGLDLGVAFEDVAGVRKVLMWKAP